MPGRELCLYIQNVFSHLISGHCRVIHIFRCDVFNLKIAESRRLGAYLQELAGCASHTCGAAVCLKTSRAPATAHTTVSALHNQMAQLTGKTVMSINELTVDHNA